ncbi:hypothetical protein N7481_001349 [Penicillium waksmanii]|uniref:uncharacterized protein n=1 Tax=Penicillium waksmanii TaxID=69791 RepID=UPI0025487985|nr:uncharacterized protein N7481_001349 [Penicillium waksmanii]KAJ6000940.1 hypothetical protein N7481_001349 [Penicillium waksmanii]
MVVADLIESIAQRFLWVHIQTQFVSIWVPRGLVWDGLIFPAATSAQDLVEAVGGAASNSARKAFSSSWA